MSYEVIKMFHPTLRVPDIDVTERWIERVFGRKGLRSADSPANRELKAKNAALPTEFAVFVTLNEILFEHLDPKKLVIGGTQIYPTTHEPFLESFGWYVDGVDEVYRAITERGIGILRQHGSDPQIEPPRSAFADLKLFWTDPDDTGIRYQIYETAGGLNDLRKKPGWSPDDSLIGDRDPLGLKSCAYHTVLTRDRDRAKAFVVDLLGGKVLREERSELFAADSSYVQIADQVIEYATPDTDSEQAALLADTPRDRYYGLAWEVADLAEARRHLAAQAVELALDEPERMRTSTANDSGVAWGFVTR